ncbi:MAG: DUF402 domain-containing protein [Chloroflexota bacterium]
MELVIAPEPAKPLVVGDEVVMAPGYLFVWFLFKDQPFDIARVYRPDGSFTGFYADVLQAVQWQGDDIETLQPLVDLFLDLWITPGGEYYVLDEDELEDALAKGVISAEQEHFARAELARLIEDLERGAFPPKAVREFRLAE